MSPDSYPQKAQAVTGGAGRPCCLGHNSGKDEILWKPEGTSSSQAWRGDGSVGGRGGSWVLQSELEGLKTDQIILNWNLSGLLVKTTPDLTQVRVPQVPMVSFKAVTYTCMGCSGTRGTLWTRCVGCYLHGHASWSLDGSFFSATIIHSHRGCFGMAINFAQYL